jgi:hypothetical protein
MKLGNEDEEQKLETEYMFHLVVVKDMQGSLKSESDLTKDTPELELAALTMDLQQALPTPNLSCGLAFYRRKMWTYNFVSEQATCSCGIKTLQTEEVVE